MQASGAITAQQLDAAQVNTRYAPLLAVQPRRRRTSALYFDTGGVVLTPQSGAALKTLLALARERRAARSSSSGTPTASARCRAAAPCRCSARAVRETIIADGFDPNRITAAGRGGATPPCPPTTKWPSRATGTEVIDHAKNGPPPSSTRCALLRASPLRGGALTDRGNPARVPCWPAPRHSDSCLGRADVVLHQVPVRGRLLAGLRPLVLISRSDAAPALKTASPSARWPAPPAMATRAAPGPAAITHAWPASPRAICTTSCSTSATDGATTG